MGGKMNNQLKNTRRVAQFILTSTIVLMTFNNCSQPLHTLKDSSRELSQDIAFKCSDQQNSSKTTNYILSKTQYQNTLEDLFGAGGLSAVAVPLSALAGDSNNADDNKRLTTISSSQAISYYDIASTLATYIVANNTRITNVFGSCAAGASPSASCIDGYLNGFAQRILRRPLTVSEISFAKNQIMMTSGTYKENLKALLTYHLISPAFLWTLEQGTLNSSGARLALTPYEVATRLAYLITDSTPDPTLLAAAADTTILTPPGLQQQVQRLIQSPRGKTKIINSLLRWSLSDQANDVTSLPAPLLNGVSTSGLQAAMLAEVRTFVDHILYTQNGTLQDLLTSKLSFASHPGLASIYGHTPITGVDPATVSERRQGLLMKAPFYTWSTPRTNIIMRGVQFQKRVLCNEIPLPNVDLVDDRDAHVLTDAELLMVTNRAAITYQTDTPLCMSCHSTINPTGFAFENLDSLGRIRSQEMIFDKSNNFAQSLPVHTSTAIPLGINQGDLPVADSYDFITNLANSPRAAACVTRNFYRAFYEKKETPEDDCQLQNSFDITKESQRPLLESIEKIFTSTAIYYKEI